MHVCKYVHKYIYIYIYVYIYMCMYGYTDVYTYTYIVKNAVSGFFEAYDTMALLTIWDPNLVISSISSDTESPLLGLWVAFCMRS